MEEYDQRNQEHNDKYIPLRPGSKERNFIVIIFHDQRLRNNPDASNPIANPINKPTCTLFIRKPIANPNSMTNAKAIFPRF
ncbi:hypothetical protein [Flavisolibacter tropicus]|uniref:Uncharacterized protein n=1 Tax=Flavisolibacter tropicus TaxID=1492898 RepID=A0A172U0Q0_9BACT|nr:hypothetical protein [Flavisolibacter tropicus]ANE52890.1 hypothetical protein SY85_22810 [Flavisolibacter tropicus]